MTADELREEIMKIELVLKQRQAKWETPKAVAALAAAAAVFAGFVFAAGNWLHPPPQQITVHLDQPLAVQLKP